MTAGTRGFATRVARHTRAGQALGAAAFVALAAGASRAQTSPPTNELLDVFPPDTRAGDFVMTSDARRVYYTTTSGDLWLYDRDRRSNVRVLAGRPWDLTLSPQRDAMAYTKVGANRREQHVWVLRLDPRTGLANGSERQLSRSASDVPSISPDGERVAFARDDPNGVGQSLVVVPIDGGPEVVVAAALPSGIGNIRWTPDGSTLYFGVNPALQFVCAESCLTFPGGQQATSGTIRRVAATGGPVTLIATTGNPNPGLSPDGRLLAFADTGRTRRILIADLNGRVLHSVTPATGQSARTWHGNSSLLLVTEGAVSRVYVTRLPDEAPRMLFQSNLPLWTPAWSHDGRTVVVGGRSDNGCAFRLLGLDGSLQKTVPESSTACGFNPAFTSDPNRIIYLRYAESGTPAVAAIDIASNRVTELVPPEPDAAGWMLDDGVAIVARVADDPPRHRISFWSTELDGHSRLIHERSMPARPAWIAPLNRTTAVLEFDDPYEAQLLRLEAASEPIDLRPTRDGYFQATVSRDARWVAYRLNPSGADATAMNVLELSRFDGGTSETIELPFLAQRRNTLAILRDGKELIVTERPTGDSDAGIYVVDVATRSVRKLLDYTPRGRLPEFAVSPDGSAVVIVINQSLSPQLTTLDLSRMR